MDGKNDCFQEEISTDAGQYNGCEKYGNSFVVWELMLKEFLVMVLYRRRTEHKSMTILMIAPVVTGI